MSVRFPSIGENDKGMAPWERLAPILFHDADAILFLRDLAYISHVWDDLVDRDKEVANADISRAFTKALVGFASNAFYAKYVGLLTPVLVTGILNWHAANTFEAEPSLAGLHIAYTSRCRVGDVALLVAQILGGHEHAITHAADIKMIFQQDLLEEYLNEHKVVA